eukprot:m.2656 g.2656  ORF g.2656 m.2656 type:complete len:296 (+) comp8816_c0_seq1:264-1151(+)
MRWSFVCLVSLFLVHLVNGVNKPTNFNSHVNSLFRNAVVLGWDEPSDLGQVSGFSLVYYPESLPDLSKMVNIDKKEVGLLVENLRFYTPYKFELRALDSDGKEGFRATTNLTTGEGAPSSPPRNVKVATLNVEQIKVTWIPPTSDSWNGVLRGYWIRVKDNNVNTSKIFQFSTTALTGTVSARDLNTQHQFSVSVAAVTVGAGVYSEPVPVPTIEISEGDSSLVIIMCCAIIIPLVLIGLFIAFYIMVLRPAFRSGKENIEEVPDMDKSDVKLTDLNFKGNGADSGIVPDDKYKA